MSLTDTVKLNPTTYLVFKGTGTPTNPAGGSNPDELSKHITVLSITNDNKDRNVAYKVKTTAPKNYVVKPNQGIIES